MPLGMRQPLWALIRSRRQRLVPFFQIRVPCHQTLLRELIVTTCYTATDSLENYSRKPDCFRKAAGLIRTHCGQLDMGEGARINAAIYMTLCELATATHHSTPLECVPFVVDSALYHQPPSSRSQGECVDALSRSAQSWSSYSGYLREVPQLCFAFRRWNDIDTARDIYKNATLEQAALLRLLISREKDAEKFIRGWESRLMEFQEAVLQLQSASAGISTMNAKSHSRLETDMDDALVLFKGVLVQQTEHVSQLMHHAEVTLERVSHDHARELSSHLASFGALFGSHLDSIFARSLADSQASLSLTNHVQEQWANFGSEITSLSQSVILLSTASSEAARVFDVSFQQAHLLHNVQREASVSAAQLVDTISRLTATTHTELEKINSTAAFIHQNLLFQHHGPLQWLYAVSASALQRILRVDPVPFSMMLNLPVYRFIFVILTLLWHLMQAALSGIMTLVLATLSVRRYLSKYAKSPLQSSSQETQAFVSSSLPLPLKYRLYPSSIQIHRPHHRRSYALRVSRIPDRLTASC